MKNALTQVELRIKETHPIRSKNGDILVFRGISVRKRPTPGP